MRVVAYQESGEAECEVIIEEKHVIRLKPGDFYFIEGLVQTQWENVIEGNEVIKIR